MRTFLLAVFVEVASFFCIEASAQPAGSVQSQSPLTRDLGAVVTLAALGAATQNSVDLTGFNVSRVACLFRLASATGSPSVTVAIQNKDVASGQYYSLVTLAAITSTAASNNPIYAGAGLQTTSNVSVALPIARTWRIQVVNGGGGSTVTGTVGCSVQ